MPYFIIFVLLLWVKGVHTWLEADELMKLPNADP